ncbi:uncharacterized protein LAESUDRAFT_485074 [Laetiporus sulphureus 93-53]|uniref:F-box domain-containing protein n=1 Tax=Laetiporus sulphureus 93-53 TaxID=1314785 RepID=A0A165BMP0_9APHY|nr:uncharacterized protein LAESUDRAFT_485074 [Laetiporus sulphureus 93-53]KZT01318.1 hypothetical protein LAESUDRAFT_485074 [Laetiporus sulphureus 93-53]
MASSVDDSPRQPLLETLAARLSTEMGSMSLEQLLSLEATLLSSLAQVRGSINMTVSPANRLPVEILARIFEHVPKLVPFHQYNTRWGHGVRDFRTLLKVTHVCRRWRDIALSMQTLWGHISNGDRDPRVWQEILERSGDKALHVSLNHSIDQSLATIFESSPSRLVELHLHFFRGWILASSLNFSVPNLRKLTIEEACFSPYVQNRSGAPTIFKGIAPTLRSMELRGTDVFPNLRLPNLTHLSLDHCSRTSGSQTLLSLLSRAPNLVHLVIFDSELYNHPRPAPEALTQSVPLSKLRRLDIYTDGDLHQIYSQMASSSSADCFRVARYSEHHSSIC